MAATDPRNAGHGANEHDEAYFHNPDVAHEASDVNVRAVLGFAAGLAVVTVISAVIVYGLFWYFERQAQARDPRLSPLAMPSTEMPRTTAGSPFFGGAPQPQLLTNEPEALREFHRTEDQLLRGYGWVDEKDKVAHIPIEEAKKRLLEHGLPARTVGVAPWLGTRAPAYGEASSGRTIPTKQQ